MARLFVAVWPSPAVTAALHALAVAPEPGVRPVASANWHITLRFLGECQLGEVVQRLADAHLPAATVTLGPALARLGRGPLVIPADGADDLASAVGAATADLGDPPRPGFVGHLTVARTKRGARPTAVGRAFTAVQAVDEIALVESELSPHGAVYSTRATFATHR